MTDHYTEHRQFPPDPPLRVAATFPASDGRVPEEIVIEVGGTFPVDPHFIDRAVNALARVAAGRDLPGGYEIVHHSTPGAATLLRTLEETRAAAANGARDGARQVHDGEQALAAAQRAGV